MEPHRAEENGCRSAMMEMICSGLWILRSLNQKLTGIHNPVVLNGISAQVQVLLRGLSFLHIVTSKLILYRRITPLLALATVTALATYGYAQYSQSSIHPRSERSVVVPARGRDLDSESTLGGIMEEQAGKQQISYFVRPGRSGESLLLSWKNKII